MKKKLKQLLCLVCCFMLTISSGITAFAAPPDVGAVTPAKVWHLGASYEDVVASYYEEGNTRALIINGKDNSKRYACDSGNSGSKTTDMITWLVDNNKTLISVYIDSNVDLLPKTFYGYRIADNLVKTVEFVPIANFGVNIPEYCFSGQTSLESVKGIEYVDNMGDKSFFDCSNIKWPNGILDLSNATLTSIPDQAFDDAGEINTIVLPDHAISLGDACFLNLHDLNLVKGMHNVTSMGSEVFGVISKERDLVIERDLANNKDVPTCVKDYVESVSDPTNTDKYTKIHFSQYELTWNLVDGNNSAPVKSIVDYKAAATLPDAGNIKNNNKGIFTEYPLTNSYTLSTPVTEDKQLYAKMADTYTVKFDTKGLISVPSWQILPNDKTPTPTMNTDGYIFNGWYTDAAFTTAWDFNTNVASTNVDANNVLTLYAKLERDPSAWYTVSFNTGDGSKVDDVYVRPNETVAKPADPTRTGYTFGGWYSDAACTDGKEWDFSKAITASVTVYAKWVAAPVAQDKVTVTFESNGGSAIEPIEVVKGSKVTKPADPTKTGYEFKGWYKDATCSTPWNFETGVVNSNITLYAGWKEVTGGGGGEATETYTVTFKLNGGKSNVATMSVTEGSLITKPKDPTKTGHTFDAWYFDENCTIAWNFAEDTVEDDMTLYANWIPNEYTVKFKLNGGDGEADTQTVTHGEYVEEPEEPTKDDYIFDGWYTSADFKTKWDFESNKVTKNLTLHAKWLSNEVTVVFDSQGGSAIDHQVVTRGAFAKAPTPPTRDNYIFGGWYKEAECKNAFSFSTKITDDITLYAKWTTTQVTVTFNSQGGSNVASAMVAPGSTVAVPVPPTRQGYTFLGWYKDAECKTAWNFTTDVVNADTTLYAKWIAGTVKNPQTSDVMPLASGSLSCLMSALGLVFCRRKLF